MITYEFAPICVSFKLTVNTLKSQLNRKFRLQSRVRKGFKCYCGKSYKTSQGLKNHSMVVHNTTSTEALNNNNNNMTRPHSPSSASNGGTSSFSSQSQLSPNSSANGSTLGNATTTAASTLATTLSSASSSPTFTQSVSQSNQITLKTPPNTNLIAVSSPPNNSHALLSTHNPNKLVKLNSECFDGVLVGTKASGKNVIITSAANGTTNGNIIVSATTAIPNVSNTDDTNGNGAKINLPSLVNLGILTPATSPKQHIQLTPQISPNHTPASNATNNNNNINNNHNNNNNENSLPLTPISPLNKTFNGSASVSIGNTTTNNNNATSPNLNNGILTNSITTDGSLTEDT